MRPPIPSQRHQGLRTPATLFDHINATGPTPEARSGYAGSLVPTIYVASAVAFGIGFGTVISTW